jgi:hypothetical protein
MEFVFVSFDSILEMYRSTLEVRGQTHSLATLPLDKEPPVAIGYEAGWAPETVWTTWRGEKPCP